MSRAEAPQSRIHSDSIRYDGSDSSISVSVSTYNYYMMMGKMERSATQDWVILLIDPAVLASHDCSFYYTNAATRGFKYGMASRKTAFAFGDFFEDRCPAGAFDGTSFRAEAGLPDAAPTDPRAEVQVGRLIEPERIIGAWTQTRDTGLRVQAELNKLVGAERDVIIQPFTPRFRWAQLAWG